MLQAEDLISGSRRLGGVSPDTARSDSAASRLSLDPVPTHRGRLEVSVVAAQYHRSPLTIQWSCYHPPSSCPGPTPPPAPPCPCTRWCGGPGVRHSSSTSRHTRTMCRLCAMPWSGQIMIIMIFIFTGKKTGNRRGRGQSGGAAQGLSLQLEKTTLLLHHPMSMSRVWSSR